MIDPPDRELAVFSTARQMSGAARGAYLDEACAGDVALRQRVEELLAAGEQAGDFLAAPAATPPGPAEIPGAPVQPTAKPGDRIGRYKLLQQIGEGGCGVVYMAEQEEPVRRRVALKVIKLGMDTKSVVARFEAERQALALMDHPNIAKVLDAGATEAGRPYFVMELVRGTKITEYCDRNNLSTPERLDLFIKVCQAIQHAHQKGIIHRDIKPSNILVTQSDGVAVPKVIDFGIAKATHGKLTDQTLFTAFEQFIGTPAYMSPEQAELSANDIDTRSDIYSLGVLLYELLTGQTPFSAEKLLQAGLDEIRRTIREEEPARPSTRLSTMLGADLTEVAKCRKAEPPKLIHLVRGDLDWIVMKSLEKNRARRYETANGLAADIQRHLNNEPVVASPPSNLYQFQKLVLRHKLVFVAVLAVTLTLCLGVVVSTWMFFREQQAHQQAELAGKLAQTEAAKDEQVAHFLQDMLEGVGPEKALGRDTTMLREILDRTKQRLDGGELRRQPAVEADLRATIAGAYQQLGSLGKAEAEYRLAQVLQNSAQGEDSTNAFLIANAMVETMIDLGELTAAEPIVREKLARSQKLFGEVNPEAATSLHELAVIQWRQGDLDEADKLLREVLAQFRQFNDPIDASAVLGDLGLELLDRGNLAAADASLREAVEMRTGILPPEDPRLATSWNNLALALWNEGKLAEAEAIDRRTLETDRRLYHDGSPDTAGALNNLADVLRDGGNFATAEALQRECLAMVEKFIGPHDPHTGIARNNLATLLRRHGAAAADAYLLRESLKLSPGESATADALEDLFEWPLLTSVFTNLPAAARAWRWTSTRPGTNWAEPDYSDSNWPAASVVTGAATFAPRTPHSPINTHTNLWLRREFELATVPAGKLMFRINRNQDAQIFLNGANVIPAVDWSDTAVLLPVIGSKKAALRLGRNVLAVQCEDADGGVPIDVQLFVTQDPGAGHLKLTAELANLIRQEPERAELYGARADILARAGSWNEAAADLSKSVEIEPTEPTAWCELAPLVIQTNDFAGYRRLRQEALSKFADCDNPVVAAQIARMSLLLPLQGEELATAAKLADIAGAAEYTDGYIGARQLAKGLAEYRQGRFANSLVWMDKVLVTAGKQNLPGWSHERDRNQKVMAYLVESMARFETHDNSSARAKLDQAVWIIENQFPAVDSTDIGHDWPAWLTAHILLREAQALVDR